MLEECEIPSEDEMEFRLDEQGVYQVYENKKGESLSPIEINVYCFSNHYLADT